MIESKHNPNQRIVGLAGNAAVGKDTFAHALEGEGFTHISMSDYVREEILRQGLEVSRQNQNIVANAMRLEHGGDYWVNLAMRGVSDSDDVVLSGVYAPSEALAIQHSYGGVVVGMGNPGIDELGERYERVCRRADGGRDLMTYEEFVAAYQRENSGTSPSEANIETVLQLADIVVVNVLGRTAIRAAITQTIEGFERG